MRPFVLLTALAVVVAWGCAGGMSASLGPPRPDTVFTVKPPPGGRFDYIVHIVNSSPSLNQAATRLARARAHIQSRCVPEQVVDLYAHVIGAWEDGSTKVSYAIGVHCRKPEEGD